MKKLKLAVLAVAAVAVLAFASVQFWWRPSLEAQIREHLDSFNAPDSPFQLAYDKTSLSIDAIDRTLQLSNLAVSSTDTENPWKITIGHLALQASAELLTLSPDNLPTSGNVQLAKRLVLQNVAAQMPLASLTLGKFEASNLNASAALLRDTTSPDFVTLLSQMGADACLALDVYVSSSENAGRLAVAKAEMRHWQGKNVGAIALANLEALGVDNVSAQIAKVQVEQFALPDKNAMSSLCQASNGMPLEQFLPQLLEHLGGNDFHPFHKASIETLAVTLPEGTTSLDALSVDWPTVRPQTFTLSLRNATVAKPVLCTFLAGNDDAGEALKDAASLLRGMDAIQAHAQLSSQPAKGNAPVLRETLSVDLPELGTLAYSHTADYSNPEMGGMFSNLKLHYEDWGLLARLGLLLSPSGRSEKDMLAMLDSFTTGTNAPLVEQLKRFVHHPGTMTITTLPDKVVSESHVLSILANPADYFAVDVIPGEIPLQEQSAKLLQIQ